jgi:hypothetical protein
MARLPRIKVTDEEGWYHLHARCACVNGEYPLEEPACRFELLRLLKRYTGLYQCVMAAFCIMGNHWHAVMRFLAPREMEGGELRRLAERFYPGERGRKRLAAWTDPDWKRFEARVFDVSEFMRNVQSEFARWYNDRHDRRGRFWADRFGSVLLGDQKAVLDCMLYVELNPVRAGIAVLPEDHRASSCHLRVVGDDGWLMDVGELLEAEDEEAARRELREMLIWRGTEVSAEGQAAIPEEVARREEQRGYAVRGVFTRRVAHLTEGLVLGGAEFVSKHLGLLRQAGIYKRRRQPIDPDQTPHFVLRPQQSGRA